MEILKTLALGVVTVLAVTLWIALTCIAVASPFLIALWLIIEALT